MTLFHLNADQLPAIEQYLRQRNWIAPDETLLSAKKPGEGNMNYTLRIRTSFRSFILKQSRDYVEKYPVIPAPRERVVVEGHFYELIQQIPELRAATPEMTFLDEENAVMMLEDLGESSDFSFLYRTDKDLRPGEIEDIMGFLSLLHEQISPEQAGSFDFSNRAMRELNAEHIFRYPLLEDNGFNLDQVTPGLQELAMEYKRDKELVRKVEALSGHYLGRGKHLLHGDYYPGSWLRTLNGVKIIDPEFCFFGPAEFDLAVTIAHNDLAQLGPETRAAWLAAYHRPPGFSEALLWPLAGVEILRRLIGLAQLPLDMNLETKAHLLREAKEMIG